MGIFARMTGKIIAAGAVPAVGSALLLSCSPSGGGKAAVSLEEQLARGAGVYEMSCAQCHYDGTGSSAAPDLKGSPVFQEPPAALVKIILKGQSGVSMVHGRKFKGTMPAQAYLTDEEIAAVVAYTRDLFGGVKAVVPQADVAGLR